MRQTSQLRSQEFARGRPSASVWSVRFSLLLVFAFYICDFDELPTRCGLFRY
jgi:hypothetical protein